MMCVKKEFPFSVSFLLLLSWSQLPLSTAFQYYVLGKDGSYKYGYRTADGTVARQEADSTNQVAGHFFYKDDLGNFGLRYTSGVQGYQPSIGAPSDFNLQYPYPRGVHQSTQTSGSAITGGSASDVANIHGNSYQYAFDTGNLKKQESSDQSGNTQGSFEYKDDGGRHDLSYFANDRTGFKVTGGNLAHEYPPLYTSVPAYGSRPNLTRDPTSGQYLPPFTTLTPLNSNNPLPNLGGHLQELSAHINYLINSLNDIPFKHQKNRYYFFIDTQRYRIEQSSSVTGEISGYFQSEDERGRQDLSYVISDRGGFQVTGGSLAQGVKSGTFPALARPGNQGKRVGGEKCTCNDGTVSDGEGKDDDDVVFVTGTPTEEDVVPTK